MIEPLGPFSLTPSEVADRMGRFESTDDSVAGISGFELIELMSEMISSQSIMHAPEGYIKLALYFLKAGLITGSGHVIATVDEIAELVEDDLLKAGKNF